MLKTDTIERRLGRKTFEVEILKEALHKPLPKNQPCLCGHPWTTISCEGDRRTLGVSRSTVHDSLKGNSKARSSYLKADDTTVLPMNTALVPVRPAYGYRRITALLNRQLLKIGGALVCHKRIYRIMRATAFLLARKYETRPGYEHEGEVVAMRSNLRWCYDGFEFHCWNGEVVRGVRFVL